MLFQTYKKDWIKMSEKICDQNQKIGAEYSVSKFFFSDFKQLNNLLKTFGRKNVSSMEKIRDALFSFQNIENKVKIKVHFLKIDDSQYLMAVLYHKSNFNEKKTCSDMRILKELEGILKMK